MSIHHDFKKCRNVFVFVLKFLSLLFWERERERQGRAERKNPKQAPHCLCRAWCGAQLTKHEIMAWANMKSQTLNCLSHLGIPRNSHKNLNGVLNSLIGQWLSKYIWNLGAWEWDSIHIPCWTKCRYVQSHLEEGGWVFKYVYLLILLPDSK